MKLIQLPVTIEAYDNHQDFTEQEQQLFATARKACLNAHAPYSKFQVGAAVLLADGQVFEGNNQENAAYPSGLCAERVAIFQAGATYPEAKILKIAISAASDTNTTKSPIPPCGGCRQSIAEYEFKQEQPIEIYFMGESGEIYMSNSVKNILPLSFDKSSL